ncbi:MAG: c-type cytochrome [Rhodobacteraceae bacterium]|nr:c-type cytochrome [Paracoccaceae bacterium]
MRNLVAIAALAAAAACVMEPEMPTRADGAAVFEANCAICHGAGARGDGLAAGMMQRRVPDLTRIAARAGGFDRARVLSMIDGYTRPPVAGMEMPEFGDLLKGDTVPVDVGDGVMTPTPRPLAALMVYLEAVQR